MKSILITSNDSKRLTISVAASWSFQTSRIVREGLFTSILPPPIVCREIGVSAAATSKSDDREQHYRDHQKNVKTFVLHGEVSFVKRLFHARILAHISLIHPPQEYFASRTVFRPLGYVFPRQSQQVLSWPEHRRFPYPSSP